MNTKKTIKNQHANNITVDSQKTVNKHSARNSKTPNQIFWLAFILFGAIVVGIIGYRWYQQAYPSKQTVTKKTVIKQVLVRRSKILGVITRATTARVIDVKTGKVIQAARIFSLNDRTIYLALDLASAAPGTFIDYIRYLNGRYVDHGNVKITRDATNNITFNWTNLKSLGSIGDGKWKIATYTNGILEKRVSYLVQKSAVSYVYPEENIAPSDSDYNLSQTFAALPHNLP